MARRLEAGGAAQISSKIYMSSQASPPQLSPSNSRALHIHRAALRKDMATWSGRSHAEVRSMYLGAPILQSISLYIRYFIIYIYIYIYPKKKAEILVSSQSEGDAFNANGTDPSRERPSRTGSQCSSISSSPHIRSARSSYL